MQPNLSPNNQLRSSYTYQYNNEFNVRNPPPKLYVNPVHHHSNYQPETLSATIKHLENKIQGVQSMVKKKVNGDNSPTLHYGFKADSDNNKFRPVNPVEQNRPEESLKQPDLRGSCQNILKKFDYSSNLRNTTHFNPLNKFNNFDPKKQLTEESPLLKNTINKTMNQDSNNNLRSNQTSFANSSITSSKTPTKYTQGTTSNIQSSKTPVKYKNPTDNNFIKTSLFNSNNNSKNFTENSTSQTKKTFNSLNQILENKIKEKQAKQVKTIKKKSKVINGFEFGNILGKGKFGEVFLCRHQEGGFVVAIKKIVKAKVIEFKMIDQFTQEIRLHSCLDHPNIVKFYGFFEEGDEIFLVLEYMNGGTLFDYLNEITYMRAKQAVQYLRDIIEALQYMHQKSIAHRDIKPENIVISSEGVAKLCDFGWSAVVESSRRTYCGTFDYAPPEILERKNYDTSVDIWCIGVLTYELLTGRVPFEGEKRNEVMEKIVNVDKYKIDYPVEIPPEAKQFIEALMQKDPNLRPKCQDLLKFKLFSLYPPKVNKNKKMQ